MRQIKKIFIDKSHNIYVVDDSNMLYWYRSFSYDNVFKPFFHKFNNEIVNCFMLGQFIFVHLSHGKVNVFNSSFLTSEKILYTEVEKIDYILENNMIFLLMRSEENESKTIKMFQCGISSNDHYMDFVEMFDMSEILEKNLKKISTNLVIDDILVIDYYFVLKHESELYLLDMRSPNVTNTTNTTNTTNATNETSLVKYPGWSAPIIRFPDTANFFSMISDIQEVDDQIIVLVLKDGSFCDPMTKTIYPKEIGGFIPHGSLGFTLDFKNDMLRLVIDNKKIYNSESFAKRIYDILSSKIEYVLDKSESCMDKRYQVFDYIFSNPSNVSVLHSRDNCYFIQDDNKYYFIGTEVKEVLLKEELIDITHILTIFNSDELELMHIDIIDNKPILPQLEAIIPNIYRLKNEILLEVSIVDSFYNVMSYGLGVSRQIFTLMKREIEAKLQTKPQAKPQAKPQGVEIIETTETTEIMNDADLFRLGIMIYFSVVNGGVKFDSLHPAFFIRLAQLIIPTNMYSQNESEILLNILKWHDPINYSGLCAKFEFYQKNVQELIDLDLGINNSKEYLEYLLTSDLTDLGIKKQYILADGFFHFLPKKNYYKMYTKMPITFWINLLTRDRHENISFTYEINEENNMDIEACKKNFEMAYHKKNSEEKIIIIQNITGGHYYGEPIIIEFCQKKKPLVFHRVEYGVELEDSSDSDLIPEETSTTNAPIIEEIITSFDETDNNKHMFLEYKISTCMAKLQIFIHATEDNIDKIMHFLAMEDLSLKN